MEGTIVWHCTYAGGQDGVCVQLASELQLLMINTLNEGIDNVWGSVGRVKE